MKEEMVDCFSNIHYTHAWYWKQIAGFFNVECYKLLAAWDQGVRPEEEVERQIALESDAFVSEEDNDESCKEEGSCTKKRKA